MTDAPLLRTPGELLAAARDKAGLDLEQLAERTKIPSTMLEAIERDEYHKISGQLYVRSFLRSYAVEVGLDPDQVLELHGRFSGEGLSVPGADRAQVWAEDEVVVQKVGLPWRKILGVAAVLLAVLAVVLILVQVVGQGDVEEGSLTTGLDSAPLDSLSVVVPEMPLIDDQGSSPAGEVDPEMDEKVADPVPVPADPEESPPEQSVVVAEDPDVGGELDQLIHREPAKIVG